MLYKTRHNLMKHTSIVITKALQLTLASFFVPRLPFNKPKSKKNIPHNKIIQL